MSFVMNESIAQLVRLQRTWMREFTFDEVRKEYYKSCVLDFKFMFPFFPEKMETVLDIGAGVGGIDLLICRRFEKVRVDLLDKDEVLPELWYGFSKEPAAYNTELDTKNFFALNGIWNIKYYTEYPEENKYDFIFSRISCGFHYPVQTYLKQIKRTLNKRGRLFLDVRKNKGEIDALKKEFGKVKILNTQKAMHRIICDL